ncbi:hypothetical protein KGF56_001477 [Candida oxycetoniae]|uniref:Nucleolar pre-ribosomal-associated protein 1 C-terminal domain-containing protein n=1 Tax=Candida oxycetoniae TaxID=497107 RepID=A0AAI9SZK7_9ASCO|nr:uncharacterized protein KGF56_001477 [Candida oxycetoniae]KAI3405869.2 hypothetical protein KGF56_001477 [Candida oxycetoniae]
MAANFMVDDSTLQDSKQVQVKRRRRTSSRVLASPSINVDYHVIQELSNVLTCLSGEVDIQQVVSFVEKDYLGKLFSIWSYYAATNNHKELVAITNQVSSLISIINENKLLFHLSQQKIVAALQVFLTSYTTTIYRALSSLKPSLVNPNIRLLDNIIKYDPALVETFLNNFDLSLAVLPKLVTPSKIEIEQGEVNDLFSIRSNFIKFWISLCSNVSSLHRLDLLINHPKIVRNIWKYLQYDTLDSIHNLIEFLNKHVLDELNFKKSEKCKILNDNFMFKVNGLFNSIKDGYFIEFMNKLTMDFKSGIIFPNDKFWNKESSLGVIIEVNYKTFKVANKLIYTLLTSLKPTDSNQQLQFIVRVLSSCQELVAPYMEYIVQHGGGYHDPSLTSWWISHTLLYTNILQIPIPTPITKFSESNNSEFSKYDAKLIAQSINLAPLSKSALVKGLQAKKKLIVQLTLQLILYMLLKLEKVLQIVNVSKQELIDIVFDKLPDISIITQVLTLDSKISQLTALTVISKYDSLMPLLANKSSLQKLVSTGISHIIEKKLQNLKSFDLIVLDLYMNLQNQDFKWWNKISNGQSNSDSNSNANANSFYTLLLKLASSSNISSSNFVQKIYTLLNKLSEEKMFFNEKLLVTPIMALIYSVESKSEMDQEFWNMLDETISRCVRTPYKYLDASREKFEDTSIFVVALVEQFKYLINKKEEEGVNTNERGAYLNWLSSFAKYLVIFGASKSAVKLLLEEVDANLSIDDFVDFGSQSSPVDKDSSFLEIIYKLSTDQLIQSPLILEKKIISSNLDYVACLSLIHMVIDKTTPAQQLISILFSKIWNFLTSLDKDAINYFVSDLIWTPLFERCKSNNENAKMALLIYNEILQNLPHAVTTQFSQFVVKNLLIGDESFVPFIWTIEDDDQVSDLLNKSNTNEAIFKAMIPHAVKKQLPLSIDQFWRLFEMGERDSLLIDLIDKDLIVLDQTQLGLLVDKISKQPNFYFLLPTLIKKWKTVAIDLIDKEFANSDDDDDNYSLRLLISSSMIQEGMEIPSAYLKHSLDIIKNKLNLQSLDGSQWSCILIILLSETDIDQELVGHVLESIPFKHTLNPQFIQFISKKFLDKQVKTWLNKCMLYITKKFTESDSMSETFNSFLISMGEYFFGSNIWSVVGTNILNTQLEAILESKWVASEIYLQYIIKLILCAPKNKIDFLKIFQIALNTFSLEELPNKDSVKTRYYCVVIIFLLYNFDHSKLSNLTNLDIILEKYQGLNRAEDCMLKFILQKMEGKLAVSWISKVSNWVFLQEEGGSTTELDKLVTKTNGQFTVKLSKSIIENTLNSVQQSMSLDLSKPQSARVETWKTIQEMELSNSLVSVEKPAYDAEFLLMIILNNEELLKCKKREEDATITYAFNIKNLVDSGLLQFLIADLANEKNLSVSKIILNKIITSIDDEINHQFKDKNLMKVFLSSILFTLSTYHSSSTTIETETAHQYRPCGLIWFVYSQFVPILANPGHFLYEKVYRYVLSHPRLTPKELPLWNLITHPQAEGSEYYYRELNWMIEKITQGTNTISDLFILKIVQIETILNTLNLKYLNMKLKTAILLFIYKIQQIDQGCDLLITRFGMLSNLALIIDDLNQSGNGNGGDDDEVQIFDQQIKNDILAVLCRIEISVSQSQRVQKWTGGDLKNGLKRLHASIS